MRSKKKGFTLIELLAVIVILAIIALIATPIIMDVIEKTRKGSLEAVKNTMIKAAELYTMDNLETLSLGAGEKEYIQLSQLETKYMKKVKNPGGSEECEGYVRVENVNGNYEYVPYLDCGDGQNLLVSSSYVNYGGNYLDEFLEVIITTDGGYLAVGSSNSSEFSGNRNKGNSINTDAVIVKYDSSGNEVWSKNFGGSGEDFFYDALEVSDGYIVVGSSTSVDGDMTGEETDGASSILLKYDKNGEVILTKVLFTSTRDNRATKIINSDGKYYVAGNGRGVITSANLIYLAQYDENFNQNWVKGYGGTRASVMGDMKLTQDNNLIIVGRSSSNDGDTADMKIGALANNDAVLYVLNPVDGNIIKKSIFGGTDGSDSFLSVTEVDDGYVAVGTTTSTDWHMQDLSIGGEDAVVVKFSKASDNEILPIEWIRPIGGTSDDYAYKVIYDDKILITGKTNSIDFDFSSNRVTNNRYYDGFVAEIEENGDISALKTYGGSKSDSFRSVVSSDNGYVLVGNSFSTDYNLESFNLGNSDAIMVKLNKQLETSYDFQLKTLLKQVPKELSINYGVSIPTVQNSENLKLYTTNDATADLGKWCTSNNYINPSANYNYVPCLKPFDNADIVDLYKDIVKYSNIASITPESINNWLYIGISFSNVGSEQEISNLRIKVEGKEYQTFEQAVQSGDIEPLVLVGSTNGASSTYFFPNSYELLFGQTSGYGKYSTLNVLFKPRNKRIIEVSLDSTYQAATTTFASLTISEFHNFDISLTKSE